MIQGTGSDVGKSLVVAGLCRALTRRGLTVRPFKAQNMSNNAAVTPDGGEIGRAQALQARACGVPPSVDMNPILLKPQSDSGSQVILRGRVAGTLAAGAFRSRHREFLDAALASFRTLQAEADIVIVEGAGSASETNLRAGDVANMGFAEAADLPVVLVADIHRGGVIANLVGTATVLTAADRKRIEGYVINRFRGDTSLFAEALTAITKATGWPSFGILTHFPDAARLPAEDSMALEQAAPVRKGGIRVGVPVLPRISNFDDLDPLANEEDVSLIMVRAPDPLPGDLDLVILPGSKSTISDLNFFRETGWDIDLAAHIRRGGRVLGLCGGYQMLGTRLDDPDGTEGLPGSVAGLGHLDVETILGGDKTLTLTSGTYRGGNSGRDDVPTPIGGYEMHIGRTDGPDRSRPFATLADNSSGGHPDGAVSPDGRIAGTYLHGLFATDAFRAAFLAEFRTGRTAGQAYDPMIDRTLNALADHLETCLDVDAMLGLVGRGE
ncbi:cobyric acid synthase [Fodinicurvata sp. EGI_FJ10296]|uniref:cobyric acid synthase n=1 Tax=Fodinicurvata sp. EGI_FJ10296 TaxID=3231908 RepID=UPI003454ABDE